MRRIVSKELKDMVRDKVDSLVKRKSDNIHDIELSLTDAIIAFNSAMKTTFYIMLPVLTAMMLGALACKSEYMMSRIIEICWMLFWFYLVYLVLINVGFFACVLSVMIERSKNAPENEE